MDQTVLVNLDLQKGAEVVAALDRANVKVDVALFANLDEYGDWRLVLAARAFDRLEKPRAYRLVRDSVDAAGMIGYHDLSILIYRMSHPFIRELRKKSAKWKYVEGDRIALELIADKFVDDSYVYRIR
jgi:hypothetical protein